VSAPLEIRTEGILFDMDGVLISSIGSVIRCWRRWAKIYGIEDAENYEVPHGVRAVDVVRMLRPDIDPIEGLRVIEEMEIEDTGDLKVLPGVRSLLKGLPDDRWAIVTSSTKRLLLARLQAAELPVPSRIISADMVERGKPDPEPYRRGADLLGLQPPQCIVVEDAPSGVGAGKAAGSRVLAVLGTHPKEELQAADWVIPSLENLSVEVSGTLLLLRSPASGS
jgi:sugar-phosphatase